MMDPARTQPSRMMEFAAIHAQINYTNKNMNLMAAMIVAGWDETKGGQVFSLPIGGTMVPVSWAVDGSGSTFIWGFIDSEYKHDMTREDAEDFVTRAINLAMARDGSSGGLIRLVVVRPLHVPRHTLSHARACAPALVKCTFVASANRILTFTYTRACVYACTFCSICCAPATAPPFPIAG